MNRIASRWLAPALVSVVVGAAIPATWAAASPADSSQSDRPASARLRTFTVTWKVNGAPHISDVAPAGLSSGDTLEAGYTVLGRRGGTADFVCTAVGQHYVCSGVIRLAGGDLYVSVAPADESEPAAVIGGTKSYVGATGQFTQRENEDGTGSWRIQLRR